MSIMFNTNIDPLRYYLPTKTFIHNYSQSMRCYIEDTPCLSMVEFVGHALLNSTIALNVDNITNFVHFQARRQWNGPMFTEFAGKQIPCTSPIAFGVRRTE